MQGAGVKLHNYGIIVYKKLTGSDHLSSRDLFNSGEVSISPMNIALISFLLRERTILGPMTGHITVPT
jgi:hypothetical protein